MKRWHYNAQDAIEKLGDDWGYLSLKPGRFNIRSSGEWGPEYKPDVSWLYGNEIDAKVAVWEIEGGDPDNKRIYGDAVLAALLKKNTAFAYVEKGAYSRKLGPELRCNEPSEWKRGKLIGKKGQIKVSPEIKAFFLVVEEKYESETKENTESYINIIKNRTNLLKGVTAHVLGMPKDAAVEEMKSRLRKDPIVSKWKSEPYRSS